MVLRSKTRQQGGSMVATVPAEVARRLALQPGQELYWRETRPGEWVVSALDPAQEAALEAHERVLERYREVFARLAR